MRSISLLWTLMIGVGAAVGQVPQSKPLSPFEQELVNNENQFMQAIADKNVTYVNQSVAEDFKGIGNNGDFYDRGEVVDSAHEGLPKDQRSYGIVVVRLNDDSAVVSYNLVVPGSRIRYRHMSDTWARVNGRWKLKFQQMTINLWSATDFD